MEIIINGKKYTEEKFSFFTDKNGNLILKEKKNHPFERVKEGESFYFISGNGDVMTLKENSLCFTNKYYNCANYCTDAELLRQRALYEKLERCLWRFSMENGGSGDYYPILNRVTRRWSTTCVEIQRFGPSFKTREVCERAIKEVIKPMLDGIAEEEIFSWRGV